MLKQISILMCCFDLIDKVELFKAIVMLLVMWFELNPDHGGLALSLSSLFLTRKYFGILQPAGSWTAIGGAREV